MPGYKTIIIDDEPDAGKLMEGLLRCYHSIHVEQVFTDALIALDAVIATQPAIVFADIEMPELTGLEFLEQVNKYSSHTRVVFVTAYTNYALEALQKDAFDFIPKPVSKTDLRRVVHKLVATLTYEKQNQQPAGNQRILLKILEGHHYVSVEETMFLEADSNYTNLVLTGGKKLLSSINLGRIHELFPKEIFVRISRKHIINKNYLSFMNFSKRYCILNQNGEEYKLEVSLKMKDIKRELKQ